MKFRYYILFLLFISSCDSFLPREPEDPSNIESNFNRPDNPNIVVNNLITSIITKNTVNYLRCFQDDLNNDEFQFIPTQNISALNPTFFQNWDLRMEEFVIINLFNSLNTGISPVLSINNRTLNVNPRSAVFEADYYIKVQHNMSDDSETEYEGKIILSLISTAEDYWYISTWQDIIKEDTNYPTWTKLKLNFGK